MKKILTLIFGIGILMMPVMVGAAVTCWDGSSATTEDECPVNPDADADADDAADGTGYKFDPENFDAAAVGMADDGEGQTTIATIIENVIKWLMYIMVFLSVLMFVVAGIMYITAGDSGRADTAKTYITYAIIGLVVGLIGWVITNTVANFIKGPAAP